MADSLAPAILLKERHFQFVVTLKSAIFQYGYQRDTFKFVVTYVCHFPNMVTSAVLLNLL